MPLTMQKNSDSSSSGRNVLTTTLVALGLWSSFVPFTQPVLADPTSDTTLDRGGNSLENTKIRKGGASTLQQGITKTITRGVNLDNINLEGQNLKGVAFQQSIVRFANFKNANLFSASFFDATCDNSNFEGADMTQANIELAQFKGMYLSIYLQPLLLLLLLPLSATTTATTTTSLASSSTSIYSITYDFPTTSTLH